MKSTKKLNLDICKEIAEGRSGLCLSNEYINNMTLMKWQCEKGHIWKARLKDIKTKKSWCPHCSDLYNNSLELCQKIAQEKGGACLSSEYKNNRIKMTWQCEKGHIWDATLHNIKSSKQWCPTCFNIFKRPNPKTKFNLEFCQIFAENKGGKCLSNEYINNETIMEWQCANNHIWETRFSSIKSNNHWCPFCANQRLENPIQLCQKIAQERNGRCLSENYKNIKSKLTWQCEKGHIWNARLGDIKNNKSWCPACVNIISKPQIEIYNLLTNYYHNLNIILNDTQTIKPKHLDIYIPELKLAIEYDGEYWHYSDWAIENGALKKLENKNKKCIENNIKLIRIRENAWRSNKELILNELFSEIDSLLI